MAHHRFDPLTAYERIIAFDPTSAQRRDWRDYQRDVRRFRQFVERTGPLIEQELRRWIGIARAKEAGEEPSEAPTVERLTDLPGAAAYLAIIERHERARAAGLSRRSRAA